MNKDLILKLITKRFGEYKKNRDEVQVKCPFCILRRPDHDADYSFKLYINIEKGVYNCFRCQVKGTIANLFPQLEAISVSSDKIAKDIEVRDSALEPLPECKKFTQLRYPWSDLVREFFTARNYDWKYFTEFILFCEDYKKNDYSFGPRLIFPIYQFGTYRGFQGRTIYKNTLPKYTGATNMGKGSILYNYDIAFNQSEQLVITEGFFDQISVGETAVAALGKNISDIQLRLIRLGDFKRVIVFLDKDAEREARSNCSKLSPYFNTYLAIPDRKDPGDMTKKEIEYLFKNKLERIY